MIDSIRQLLAPSNDLVVESYSVNGQKVQLLYFSSLCDSGTLTEHIIRPVLSMDHPDKLMQIMEPRGPVEADSPETAAQKVMKGFVCISCEQKTILVKMARAEFSEVSQGSLETTLQGSKDSLTEDISTNLNMIRRRYPQERLMVRYMEVGEKSKTRIALVYDDEIVDRTALDEVLKRLGKVKVKVVTGQGTLQNKGYPHPARLFPMMLITERPDRVSQSISKGRIAILMDTNPLAAIAPSQFFDFFISMDDALHYPVIGGFLLALRFLGFLVTTIMPGLYVALTAYSPEIFQLQLTLSIAGSRNAIPLPAYMEVLFMLIMTELLLEASARLPKVIGPTATTVGGLILGQAVTEAGLVSNIMIIIVASVAISNFVIPVPVMFFSVRLLKYVFLVAASLFGLHGIIVAFNSLFFVLAHNRSYGLRYLQLYPSSWEKGGGKPS